MAGTTPLRLTQEPRRGEISPLLERCSRMGIPSWDAALERPRVAVDRWGDAQRLLTTPAFIGLAGRGLAAKLGQSPGVRPFDGGWILMLPPSDGAVVWGAMAGVGISEGFESSGTFARACEEAGIPPAHAAEALREAPRFSEGSARCIAMALASMRDDRGELEDAGSSIEGFSGELTDAYETISLLYTIGRSMNNPGRAEEFVTEFVERLLGTTRFGWMSLWIDTHESVPASVSGRRLLRGALASSPGIERAMGIAANRARGARAGVILEGPAAPAEFGGSQVLSQPLEVGGKVVGAVLAGDKGGPDALLSSYDLQLVDSAARFLGSHLHTCALFETQQRAFLGTISALSAAIDAKDPYTNGHSERVAHLARQLALASGMPPERAERVHIAGLLHDVGKIGVPEAVLCKQGRLTDEEFAMIKKHPEAGHRILRDIPLLSDVLPGVLHHHERFDGKGYPFGLSGDRIPLMGRLLAICDAFDAMSSNRSYRAALPRAHVLGEIARSGGTQHDPELVIHFVQMDLTEYDRMVAAARPQAKAA